MKKLSIPLSAAIALSSVIFLLLAALFLYPAVFAGIDAVDGTALSNHHDSLLTETDNGIVYTAYKNVYALENTAKVKERSMANAMDYYRIRASEIGLSFDDFLNQLPYDGMYLLNYTLRSANNEDAQKYRDYLLEKDFTLISDFRYVENMTENDFAETPTCLLLAPDNLTVIVVGQNNADLSVQIMKYKQDYKPVIIDGIILSETAETYAKGEVFSVRASFSPSGNKYINYEELERADFESSDPSVIMVSESKYKSGDTYCSAACVGAGTAVITARAPNGITESFSVTVTDSSAIIDEDIVIPETKYLSGDEEPLDSQALLQSFAPAAFSIEAYDSDSNEHNKGRGFFISASGLAVTCLSAIDGFSEFTVYASDGRAYPAIVIRSSRRLNLALIKVIGSGFPYLEMCQQYAEGDMAYIISGEQGRPDISECKIVDAGETGENGTRTIELASDVSDIESGCALINKYGHAIGLVDSYYIGKLYCTVAIPFRYLRHFALQ